VNIRSLYRISWTIESLLNDLIDENVTDEKEVLEILLDAKRLTDLLSQELNNYIVRLTKV